MATPILCSAVATLTVVGPTVLAIGPGVERVTIDARPQNRARVNARRGAAAVLAALVWLLAGCGAVGVVTWIEVVVELDGCQRMLQTYAREGPMRAAAASPELIALLDR